MRVPRLQPRHKHLSRVSHSERGRDRVEQPAFFLAAALLFSLALLPACTIHEQKNAGSGDKKVEIKTPFGEMKVNTQVDPKDTGLPVYPGARRAADSEHDKHAANVNISSSMFGLKVVAVKFESDDPPQKVLDFYRDKVKAYGGKYLECTEDDGTIVTNQREGQELSCDKGKGHGDSIELKAGSPDRQHVVAVKPKGSGSEFTLVYVNKRGKEGDL